MDERDERSLRALPSVDLVLRRLEGAAPRSVLKAVVQQAVDEARAAILRDEEISEETVFLRTEALLDEYRRAGLQRVINATGVLLHTNLGRAPLGERQLAAVARAAAGYSNLEYELSAGARGSRLAHVRRLICDVTGAEDALVVNNNAGAILLLLASECRGREVVVSRGELVEIGGEFRIPEIISAAGVRLREVGTTNRTRLGDYERAIAPETAAILKVHPSNYRIVGFAEGVPARDLARLARARGVLFIHDVGSGLVREGTEPGWARGEPGVVEALREGADAVLCSGDKLFGGPQAGIVVGRRPLVERALKHPFARTLRADKMTLAALEETLVAYAENDLASIPLWALAAVPTDELMRRADAICAEVTGKFPAVVVRAEPSDAAAGGGSVPGGTLPSAAVILEVADPDGFTTHLRQATPPVVARLAGGRVIIDLRAVFAEQDAALVGALNEALAATGQ